MGSALPLNSGVTLIGRDPDCVVHLESRKVSKKHAQIEVLDDGARVLDLHSTNGTRVGERSAVEPILLVDGDIIEVGEFQFLFLQDESKVLEVQDASQVRMTARAEIHAEEKLRAVLSIAFEMGGTIDLDGVLAKAFDCLFRIFPSAERGFVLLENGGQIKARASKVRHGRALPDFHPHGLPECSREGRRPTLQRRRGRHPVRPSLERGILTARGV